MNPYFQVNHRRSRLGTTMVEVIVALTLLTTTLSVAAPLVVRHGWLLASQRHYRMALDEVSNQMERLSTMQEPTCAPSSQT